MKKDLIKKGIKAVGKAISILSIIFVIRAVYVLGFDFSAVTNWPVFILMTAGCVLVKCISVYISGTAWCGWLSFFSGKRGILKEGICVHARANIGKYLPGNVMHYVERNLFAGKMGISQKKIAASSLFEVFSLAGVAIIMAVFVSAGQLKEALYAIFGDKYLLYVLLAFAGGIVCAAFVFLIFRKKLTSILSEYKWSDFFLSLIRNMLLYAIVLILLGIIMVVLYCYMGGEFTWRSTALIISGYIIAWVLGFIVPGAPGGIGVRELVITLLLGKVMGESLIVTLSVTHRLITIIGDFLAYLIVIVFQKLTKEKTVPSDSEVQGEN